MHQNQAPPAPDVANRGVVSRQIIEILREFGRLHFGTHSLSETIEESLISVAIVIGQSEGRPMTATDIGYYLGYPRPTVIRKLRRVSSHRRLRKVKNGSRACYVFDDLQDEQVVQGVARIMQMICSMCSQVSKLNTEPLDRPDGSA